MKMTPALTASLLVAITTSMASAQTATATKPAEIKKGEKPKASPGWVVVEEEFFYPLRYEPGTWLHNAREHYRKSEEKAAAHEIEKAEGWLKYAAGHAEPMTKKSLDEAALDLKKLATDLSQGKLQSARHLDAAIAKADHALAEWHYFKAKDHLGKHEEKWASSDLEAAAKYLQRAADSAHHEYGSDTITLFDAINKDGKLIEEGATVSHDQLADNLTKLESEMQQMAATLQKDAASVN